MAHRYFTTDIHGQAARITGPDAAHLARVLRAKPGEQLTLCDGAGTDYTAEITGISQNEVLLRVLEAVPSAVEPTVAVTVYVGMARGERMDLAVQKVVELGAARIVPFYSAHSVVKPKNDAEKAVRYNRIALEAAKQCGRGLVPPVAQPLPFAQMLADAAQNELALFLYEGGGAALREVLKSQKTVGIITGPEGGFSAEEARRAQGAGCIQVGLGPRILRSETAPAAVLAAVMTLTGNLE